MDSSSYNTFCKKTFVENSPAQSGDRSCAGEFPTIKSKKTLFGFTTKIGHVGRAECGFFPTPSLAYFCPISSNAIFIEINPHGKIFAMNIQRAHGVGDAVAQGCHLCVQLRRQNCKLSTPSRVKMPTEHQKHNNQHKDDVTFAFISRSQLICNK
jgi:hypothetical protein